MLDQHEDLDDQEMDDVSPPINKEQFYRNSSNTNVQQRANQVIHSPLKKFTPQQPGVGDFSPQA